MFVCAWVRVCVHVCVDVCVHMLKCVCVCMCVCMYVCLYLCVCLRLCMCVYAHAHVPILLEPKTRKRVNPVCFSSCTEFYILIVFVSVCRCVRKKERQKKKVREGEKERNGERQRVCTCARAWGQ